MEQTEVIKRISDFIEYDKMVSPSAFANKAGIDPSGFSKMLKGQQTITTATLKKISTTYGLSLKWLTDGTEPQYMPSVSQSINGINGENLKDNVVNINSGEVINRLLVLLEEKDRQLAERDKQINTLLQMINK